MNGYMNLPDIGMSDPNQTSAGSTSAGGKTKITPTDKSGESYQGTQGYGFMVNGEKVMPNGMAPSGENSSGIPAAQPINPLTYGDPNNTATDRKDGYLPSGPEVDDKHYGFGKAV